VEVDLRVGGAYIIRFRQLSVVMTGSITALELGRLLEYGWLENYGLPASKVRWEISLAEGSCRLKLSHTFSRECVLNEIVGFSRCRDSVRDSRPQAPSHQHTEQTCRQLRRE
jgi:hypothetical protein